MDCLLGTGFQGSLREPWLSAETDPAFAEALEAAEAAGVRILCLPCHAEPDRLEIIGNMRH